MQRHLAEKGTSYSELVAEVRLDTACHLLAETSECISHIALRLGYAGPSSLSRTFMRMMKVQPVTYRRQHRDSGMSRGEGPSSSGPR
ncbi:helix-turn-helix transcriptional regulator [Bosea sp. F3-2]|nr:helix-turn-helix transcriptional regulator [Bosea sp. F3-2]